MTDAEGLDKMELTAQFIASPAGEAYLQNLRENLLGRRIDAVDLGVGIGQVLVLIGLEDGNILELAASHLEEDPLDLPFGGRELGGVGPADPSEKESAHDQGKMVRPDGSEGGEGPGQGPGGDPVQDQDP